MVWSKTSIMRISLFFRELAGVGKKDRYAVANGISTTALTTDEPVFLKVKLSLAKRTTQNSQQFRIDHPCFLRPWRLSLNRRDCCQNASLYRAV